MDSIAKSVTEKKVFENGRVFVMPMKVHDVVSITGSVLGGSNMLPRELMMVPSFADDLFDAGTKTHTKAQLRDSLAARGASLSFSCGGDRTSFSASCLPEDLTFILNLIVECLGTANFPTAEIAIVREQLLGSLKEAKTDTSTQAAGELARLVYDKNHVNYVENDTFVEKCIRSVTRKQLLDFRSMLGTGGLVIAVTGDVKVPTAIKAVESAFKKLGKGTLEIPKKARNKKLPSAEEKQLFIAHKTNVDVFLGAVVPLTYDDKLYPTFMVLLSMLGDGFTSHLTRTVRERDGLTYAIFTWPTGFEKDTEGAFRIWATFSPDLYERGVSTIKKEVAIFFASVLTQKLLDTKKDELFGSYVVSLSTTRALANRLHLIGTQGKALSYIDEYGERLRNMTLQDIKDAAALIPLKKLSLAAAGTFAK